MGDLAGKLRTRLVLCLQDRDRNCVICTEETIHSAMCCKQPVCKECYLEWMKSSNLCMCCRTKQYTGVPEKVLQNETLMLDPEDNQQVQVRLAEAAYITSVLFSLDICSTILLGISNPDIDTLHLTEFQCILGATSTFTNFVLFVESAYSPNIPCIQRALHLREDSAWSSKILDIDHIKRATKYWQDGISERSEDSEFAINSLSMYALLTDPVVDLSSLELFRRD